MPEPTEGAPLGDKHEPPAELVRRERLGHAHALISSDDEMRRCWRLASGLATSGLFSVGKNEIEKAFAKILIGRDLGISPTQALMSIDIVKGNLFMRGVLLASFVKRSPYYRYRIKEHTDTKCVLAFFERDDVLSPWEELGESSFSMDDAVKAGIAGNDNYKKIPRNMLLYRAVSNGVKWMCPDLLGGVPVYTEADPIPESRQLGAGTGNGEAEGLDLGPAVEAIIARATQLGHAGLSDRATVEVQLGDQTPEFIEKWVRSSQAALDQIEEARRMVAVDATAEEDKGDG